MNETGPTGQGPMTGRGMGPCGGGLKAGRCCGRGRGRGLQNPFRSSQNRLEALEAEEKMLAKELEAIRTEKQSLKGQE